MFSVTCRILERILGLFELEFFRRLAHRIRLETSKTGSIVLDRTRIPPRGSEEKMDGNEIDRWMDGSIRIVSRVEDASTIAKRGMGRGGWAQFDRFIIGLPRS